MQTQVVQLKTMKVGEKYITPSGLTMEIVKVDTYEVHFSVISTPLIEGEHIQPKDRSVGKLKFSEHPELRLIPVDEKIVKEKVESVKPEVSKPVTLQIQKKVSCQSIIVAGLKAELEIDDIIKEVQKIFPEKDALKIRSQISVAKSDLKKGIIK